MSANDTSVSTIEVAERLREFTAMKYAGDCKCGGCQLVPRSVLDETLAHLRVVSRRPGREEIARAIWNSKLLQPARGPWPENPTVVSNFCERAADDILALLPAVDEAAEVERLRKERDAQKARGDNHWETLRSIRELAKAGDCKRIIQWVNDGGSGYTDTAERTLAAETDRANAAEAKAGALRKALEECRGLAKLAETMTGCRADDEYVWGIQAKIDAALSSSPAAQEKSV